MASHERFGYEWDKFDSLNPDYEEQFLKWAAPLKAEDFKDKSVLDAGCGMGRNSLWPLRYGVESVVALDLDERTVAAARRTLQAFPQAEVRQQSIYDIQDEDRFDIAFSIGVIHHLERPHEAVKNMVRSLKPGGVVLVWVYGYEGNEWIVRFIDPLRKLLNILPPFFTDIVAFFLAVPFFIYVKTVPQTQPYRVQLSRFRFWHIRCIILDQLLPRIAHYWRRDEALALLADKGLTEIAIYPVNGLSWTVVGRKM